MINDKEVANELLRHGANHLSRHWKQVYNREIDPKYIELNTHIVSAATHYGIQDRVDRLAHLVQNNQSSSMNFLFDTVVVDEVSHSFCTNITQKELPILIQHGYLEDDQTQIQVREIRDKELSRLVNITPW